MNTLTMKLVTLAVGWVMASVAHAGRSCDQQPMTAQTLSQGLALAQRTAVVKVVVAFL